MSQSENKGLVLGVLAGTAGLSLAYVWYSKVWKPRTAVRFPVRPAAINWLHAAAADGPGAATASQGQQLQILHKLGSLLESVEELKEEVKFLKEAIPKLREQIRNELQGKAEARRISPLHRAAKKKRAEAARGPAKHPSSEEAESEGGYMTAHTEPEIESDDEKKQINLPTDNSIPRPEAVPLHLLQQADGLHDGSELSKQQGFRLMTKTEEKYGSQVEFLWRLARAYGDMFDMTADMEEKKNYAIKGKAVAEKAIYLDAESADSHQWFAILCGYMSEIENVQNKIKNGYLFKEHLDKAIELRPQDPLLYYLLGRWCYAVSQLSWIERKIAATLYGNPPSATVQEALQNFLRAEEINPGYSKYNYVYVAKCYKDLGQNVKALEYCDIASSIVSVTKEDYAADKDLENLLFSLGR
ncbi:regulator of microtubule dynamics protein 2 [Rhinatrema bivittatum]|uniref:regulator of microtubule dynamics protein 2 n=1 Tax=Rhinatrema bivittatum TaxID=194408 RepID=UPI00112AA744|nr:regulator of microtubule dynamics protein 2 [Rhinatrema bivittatum]XP_029449654.1 regulator of microtubule dynamics protein 2 [Rhinatrema bivittatum]XP_029449655.1 regulator of microtubule dynamics protein 2 [Rhinatrema bivittatum]XP_029449656.1 regulator of microtubule dynamics protein 2 [Rhinatrema bivittatum]XP_029449658.1 regulator of microtubule dynamics protein 2 [Rhinatrema bivittatum]XP_029449659.1 regulator of microtubule dynamics protein 2 [Rhinatrema bivittatum]XP_029449660.1 re